MSYNLSISGHIEDEAVNQQVQELLVTKGREVTAALAELGALGEHPHAATSGPGWTVNLLADAAEASDDSTA